MNLCFEHKFKEVEVEEKQIEIYKVREGEIVFDVDIENETMWATEAQLAELFDVDRSVINRHLRNIYRDGELEEEAKKEEKSDPRLVFLEKKYREAAKRYLDERVAYYTDITGS